VFDEASQMRVENAVPALYRAKRAVVSGDSKQLPPSSFFSTRIESEENEPDDDWIDTAELEDAEAEAAESYSRRSAANRRHVKGAGLSRASHDPAELSRLASPGNEIREPPV
jgi:primosomal replication protein N''